MPGRNGRRDIAPERLPNTPGLSGRRPAAPSPIRERRSGRGSTRTAEPLTERSGISEAGRSDAADGLSPKASSGLKIVGENRARPLSWAAFEGRMLADGRTSRFGPDYAGIKSAINGPARPSRYASEDNRSDIIQARRKPMKEVRLIGYALAAAFCAGQANAEELTGTLKNIKEPGAITIGFRDSSIPFSYLDDSQKPIGYAMDICYRIVDAVKLELKLDKLEVKLNPVTSATRIPLMANGTIDLECGSTTNNAERQKQISFTNTHFLTASRFVSKKASKINSIDALKGKSVV